MRAALQWLEKPTTVSNAAAASGGIDSLRVDVRVTLACILFDLGKVRHNTNHYLLKKKKMRTDVGIESVNGAGIFSYGCCYSHKFCCLFLFCIYDESAQFLFTSLFFA